MNFRTTLILIVLLAAVGIGLFLTREKSSSPSETSETAAQDQGTKLLDLNSADVTKVALVGSDEQPITLERTGVNWNLTQPVAAPADNSTVQTLVDMLANLRIKGTAPAIATPQFKIELTGKDGKTSKLNVGQRSATGNNLYVQREGDSQATVVAADVYDQLDKSASAFRRTKLFTIAATDIKQLNIDTPEQSMSLRKDGANWQIVQPTPMPAETSQVSDLLFAISNLQATEFVAENVDDAKRRRLDAPQLTLSFSTEAPTTQPSTQPTTAPTMITIKFGGFTDVTRKNVYAVASNSPALVSVTATSMETFTSKKPLDLRDRKVMSIDPTQVSRISISTDRQATTQPTTREATHAIITIERAAVGATQPSTHPTTEPSTAPSTKPTSQPSTAPSEPAAKWIATFSPPLPPPPPPFSGDVKPNVDSRVDSLLALLTPLRTQKYFEKHPVPTTQPADRYEIAIDTVAAGAMSAEHQVLKLTDRGETEIPVGEYNGLTFEAPRALLDAVKADWSKPAPAAPPGGDLQPEPR